MNLAQSPFGIVPVEVAMDQRLTLQQMRVLVALSDCANDDESMVKLPCRKFVAVGCGSPKARGTKPHAARVAALSILAPVYGGPDGMAQAMPVTLRVPRSSTPIRAAALRGSGTAVVHQAQPEQT